MTGSEGRDGATAVAWGVCLQGVMAGLLLGGVRRRLQLAMSMGRIEAPPGRKGRGDCLPRLRRRPPVAVRVATQGRARAVGARDDRWPGATRGRCPGAITGSGDEQVLEQTRDADSSGWRAMARAHLFNCQNGPGILARRPPLGSVRVTWRGPNASSGARTARGVPGPPPARKAGPDAL